MTESRQACLAHSRLPLNIVPFLTPKLPNPRLPLFLILTLKREAEHSPTSLAPIAALGRTYEQHAQRVC